FDREKVMALFRELEFRVLAQRLDEVLGSRPAQELMEAETDYCTISTEAELSELAVTIRTAGQVALATVSTTGDTAFPLLLCLSFSTESGKGWYIPIGHTP